MNLISVLINDVEYTDFLSYELSEDIEHLIKPFKFTLNVPKDRNIIKIGDKIVVKIDDEIFLTGFIETKDEKDGGNKPILEIMGRDSLCDLVDSRIGAKIYKTPISFVELVKAVLKSINYDIVISPNLFNKSKGISIINNYGDIEILEASDDVSHRDNDTTFEVIKRCADKRRLVLTSDGFGNLVINKIASNFANTILLRSDDNSLSNVIDSQVNIDWSKRFNQYIVKSIATGKSNSTSRTTIDPLEPEITTKNRSSISSNTINATGIAFDNEVRKTRIWTDFRQVSSLKKAQERADWERDIRKAQSFTYNCVVYGFRQNLEENIKKNPLWRVNSLVDVFDEIRGVIGTYLIKSARYNKDNSGTKTYLSLINEKAYSESMFEPITRRRKGVFSKNNNNQVIEPPL